MKADVTVKQMTAVFDAVNENIVKYDDPKNFGESLEEMWETYLVFGLDGSDADRRSQLLAHYKNMQRLMEELEELCC